MAGWLTADENSGCLNLFKGNMCETFKVSYRNGAIRRQARARAVTHLPFWWKRPRTVLQLSATQSLSHARLPMHWRRNSLLCTDAGDGNVCYRCGLEQQLAGFRPWGKVLENQVLRAHRPHLPKRMLEGGLKTKPQGTDRKGRKQKCPTS